MPAASTRAAPLLLTGTSPPPALISLVLASLPSPDSRRSYRAGIDALYAWKGPRTLTPQLLLEWRGALSANLSSATVNARFVAMRKLIDEGRHAGFLTEAYAAPLLRVKGLPFLGARVGNWLTPVQGRALLAAPDRKSLSGKRDYCVLAILLGCALRVSELAALDVAMVQQRDGRWVIADILKKRHMRTVVIPTWTMSAIGVWLRASGITAGPLIRQLTAKGTPLTPQGILGVVRKHSYRIGLPGINPGDRIPAIGPHDLRRTCARLMYAKGATLDQIRMMLGHQSLLTTQRYLGSMQDLVNAPNDDLGLA